MKKQSKSKGTSQSTRHDTRTRPSIIKSTSRITNTRTSPRQGEAKAQEYVHAQAQGEAEPLLKWLFLYLKPNRHRFYFTNPAQNRDGNDGAKERERCLVKQQAKC
jgi:hypothetical protein